MSDTNQVVIHWQSEGTFTFFDMERVEFVEELNAANTGWSLDYEIGTLDGDGNFGELLKDKMISQIAFNNMSKVI